MPPEPPRCQTDARRADHVRWALRLYHLPELKAILGGRGLALIGTFGCVKPEPEIYRLAMRNLSVGPADCIFVGDGGSEELRGARDLGITTVMITDITACPEIPGESFDLALACACFGRLIEDETEGQMPYRIAD